jgi:hypothetical protein
MTKIWPARLGRVVGSCAAAIGLILAASGTASATDVPDTNMPASPYGLPVAYPADTLFIPPVCFTLGTCDAFTTVFGQLPANDPANGEDGSPANFDAAAVDATAVPAEFISDGTVTAQSWSEIASGHAQHCSYRHHHGHHYRAKSGILYHHYHNGVDSRAYWIRSNEEIYEVYQNSC